MKGKRFAVTEVLRGVLLIGFAIVFTFAVTIQVIRHFVARADFQLCIVKPFVKPILICFVSNHELTGFVVAWLCHYRLPRNTDRLPTIVAPNANAPNINKPSKFKPCAGAGGVVSTPAARCICMVNASACVPKSLIAQHAGLNGIHSENEEY